MTDLRSHLERIPEDELLSLASLWLVRPDMPFNRQKVVQRLVGFFSSSTIRSRLMEGLDRNEAGIVTLVYVLGNASREGIAVFFAPKAHLVVDRDIDRLLKRTVLLLDEDGEETSPAEMQITYTTVPEKYQDEHILFAAPTHREWETWDPPFENWEILLQIDSFSGSDFSLNFMDCGVLCFLIAPEDLKAGKFDNVRGIVLST